MSSTFFVLLGGTFLAGILTSISPCPLATNLAAVSFLSRQTGKGRGALLAGGLYALGRVAAYVSLAIFALQLVCTSGEALVRLCGSTVHGWLGPLMILVGMALLGMLTFPALGTASASEKSRALVEKFGIWSAFPLGILFALAFCPTSAAAFLAMLGIAAEARSTFLFPAVFGLATALPVLVFSWILQFQAARLTKAFEFTRHLDGWIRRLGGVIFLGLGIWFSLVYIWF